MNLAARLTSAARPGTVLIDDNFTQAIADVPGLDLVGSWVHGTGLAAVAFSVTGKSANAARATAIVVTTMIPPLPCGLTTATTAIPAPSG